MDASSGGLDLASRRQRLAEDEGPVEVAVRAALVDVIARASPGDEVVRLAEALLAVMDAATEAIPCGGIAAAVADATLEVFRREAYLNGCVAEVAWLREVLDDEMIEYLPRKTSYRY